MNDSPRRQAFEEWFKLGEKDPRTIELTGVKNPKVLARQLKEYLWEAFKAGIRHGESWAEMGEVRPLKEH